MKLLEKGLHYGIYHDYANVCTILKRLGAEHARKPSNKSSLLSRTLGTLEADPLFDKHLHCPLLLHSQDTLVQLLSVGGPWKFLSTNKGCELYHYKNC